MFTIAQHIGNMETTKNTFRYILSVMIIVVLGACSSTNNLPADDVYYSSKTPNSTQYNWDDYQKNAQSYSDNNVALDENSDEYSTEYVGAAGSGLVTEGDQSEEYEFIDEYYDSDYASRISRFNGEGTSDDYYDDSYTSCGGSNFSLSFGVGMGYGWGMSYGYGWPYYNYGWPYYSWGYPYYGWGYPYYGGSYWAGYNHGYWDGYYAGGGYYGGGYYPDYGYGYTSAYGPRGRGAGGSSIPRSGNGRSGSSSNPGSDRLVEKDEVIRGGGYIASNGALSNVSTTPRAGEGSGSINPKTRPEGSIRVADNGKTSTEPNKKVVPKQNVQSQPSKTNNRYRKPTSSTTTQKRQTPKYQKPKSYESLPSRQPRSSKEYVRPTNTSKKSTTNRTNTNTYKRSAKQNSSRSNYSTPRTNTPSSRNSSVKTPSSSTPKSYSSPSKRSSSSGSRSTPSRSYSSPSKSYSTPSRSSSSGGGSRSSSGGGSSSSSGSRSSGGRR